MVQNGQLEETLGGKYHELSPQLQSAARFIMDNREDVATYSLRQVAKKSGLTPPTFSRLARAVGFEEYESLRDICRTELKRSNLSLAERAMVLQETNPPGSGQHRGSFAHFHGSSVINNLHRLLEDIDQERLADVVDQLAASEKVVLVGSMSSRAILDYLHHLINLARTGWQLAAQEQLSMSTTLNDVDADTTLLVLTINPYVRRTIKFCQIAHQRGAKIIAITDDIASPVLKYAHSSFLVPTDSPQYFPSYVGVLTLLEILTGMLIRRWGDDAKQRIDDVEQLSHDIGDYIY